jgi:hypothetical protein
MLLSLMFNFMWQKPSETSIKICNLTFWNLKIFYLLGILHQKSLQNETSKTRIKRYQIHYIYKIKQRRQKIIKCCGRRSCKYGLKRKATSSTKEGSSTNKIKVETKLTTSEQEKEDSEPMSSASATAPDETTL